MSTKSFSLAALQILSLPSDDKDAMKRMCKVLKQEIYLFNDRVKVENGEVVLNETQLPDDFYGEGITVQSIVGKNGSGKSSVLDLIYRIMNNVGYYASKSEKLNPVRQKSIDNIANGVEEIKDNIDEEHISLVEGLRARLYFIVNDSLHWIQCDGTDVKVSLDKKHKINQLLDDEESLRDTLSQLFYSIVTNYSVQSFIARDYKDEYCSSFRDTYNKETNKVTRSEISGTNINWLDGVFHKNDGYLSPIVLNPYRHHGSIDMEREEDLTKERLVSLLLWYDDMHKLHILDDYSCKKVEFYIDIYSLHQKYIVAERERAKRYAVQNNHIKDDKSIHWKDAGDFAGAFVTYIKFENADSIAKEILSCFKVLDKTTLGIKTWAAIYLVYKTLTIAATYPTYVDYRDLGHLCLFCEKPSEKQKKDISKLVNAILEDQSHIATKLKRVLHFMKQELKDEDKLLKPFDFNTYLEVLGTTKDSSFGNFNTQLPPPLFDVTIDLSNGVNDTSLNGLSSGERQMIYTTSTFLYHLMNLNSIKDKKRVQYRNICMILDEVEICFHPELQKKLLWNLIEMIKSFKLNKTCNINIIIATHSPFILSDIPQCNILYLEKGETKNQDITISPFAANVNEILCQSFFLSSGFMGEFAKTKIDSLLNYIKKGENTDNEWTEDKARRFINLIGDEVIKFQLTALLNANLSDSDNYKDWIKSEAKRLNIKI